MSGSSQLYLHPGAVTILSSAGPIINLSLQVASLGIAMDINKRGSVRGLSAVPFITLLMNCVIWAQYGYLKENKTVYFPALTGIACATVCSTIYDRHSKEVNKATLYRVAFAIMGASTALFMMKQPYFIGIIGCVISVCLLAAPLAALGTVLRDKSTASMPFSTSAINTLNVLVWLTYGLLVADDVMIWGPNVLGLFVCGAQMVLFAKFGIARPDGNASAPQKLPM